MLILNLLISWILWPGQPAGTINQQSVEFWDALADFCGQFRCGFVVPVGGYMVSFLWLAQ